MRTLTCLFLLIALSLTLPALGPASASDLRDFTSDGCSLFPDGTLHDRDLWCACCFAHDIAYWQGGTKEDRKQADETLRECVSEHTHSITLADMMYDGVRLGGHPAFPTWYRWEYGWKYGKGYAPLTKEEIQQVQARLKNYYERHPTGYCAGKHRDVK